VKTVQSSPILQSEAKSGLPKFWRGHILLDGDTYYLQSESWSTLADGGESKHNESVPYEVSVKNVGKKNETSPLKQAQSEFDSMVKQQKDKKNYVEEGKKVSSDKLPMPMLAHKWADSAKHIVYPAYVQKKYDGNRCLFDGERGQSRGGKPFIPEVVEHFKFNTQGHVLDGEVMLEGAKLQTSMTAIKKFRPDLSPTLLYFVYDVADEFLPYTERLAILRKLEPFFPPNVRLAETFEIKNVSEMLTHHRQFVLDGFEGTIIRNMAGLYEIGHRSHNLLKFKEFQDQEYEIIEVISGEGLYDRCAIFVCKTEDGKIFKSNPEGTISQKRAYFEDRENLKGKFLTCRFFEKTLDGIPTFNVGVSVREEGEFDK
jgi:hypothetical protein